MSQVLVVGMHRSGTSAVTQLLHALGFSVGSIEEVDHAGEQENPHGFWEHRELRRLNELLLHSVGCDWDIVLGFDKAVLPEEVLGRFAAGARQLIAGLDGMGSWVAKDPRLCLTLPYWLPLLVSPVCVFVVRDPEAVAASLRTRNDFPRDVGLGLWEAYCTSALRHLPAERTLVVSYDELVSRPREAVDRLRSRLQQVLGMELPGSADAIARLVVPEFNRSTASAVPAQLYDHPAHSLYHSTLGPGGLRSGGSVRLSAAAAAALERHEKVTRRTIYRISNRIRGSAGEDSASASAFAKSIAAAQVEAHSDEIRTLRDCHRGLISTVQSLVASSAQQASSIASAERRAEAAEAALRAFAQGIAAVSEAIRNGADDVAVVAPDGLEGPMSPAIRQLADAHGLRAARQRSEVLRLQDSVAQAQREREDRQGAIAGALEILRRHPSVTDANDILQAARRATDLLDHLGHAQETMARRCAELMSELEAERALRTTAERDRGAALEASRRLSARIRSASHLAELHLSSWRWRLGDRAVRIVEILLRRRPPRLASELLLEQLREDSPRSALPSRLTPASAADSLRTVPSAMPRSLRKPTSAPVVSEDPAGLEGPDADVAFAALERLRANAYPAWERENSRRLEAGVGKPERHLRSVKVMIGTLYSGEQEYQACQAAVARQTYPGLQHVRIEHLPNKEAHDRLYRTFLESKCELLIKIDADTVIVDEAFVEQVVRVYLADTQIGMIQMAILDYYSGGEIQGVNAYTRKMRWSSGAQDALFTDVTQTPAALRRVVWATFGRSVIHSPNPSPFQAFHFGVHRGVKALAAARAGQPARSAEQLMYLERCQEHFLLRRDDRLALACIGAELAFRGEVDARHVDYTDPALGHLFAQFDRKGAELARLLDELRRRPVEDAVMANLLADRSKLPRRARITSVLLVLPHLKIFGGVNRFLEIARHARRQGIDAVVAAEVVTEDDLERVRIDFPDVVVQPMADAMKRAWSAAVCGDFSSCLIEALAWVQCELSAVYLLNGWQHRHLNAVQVQLLGPDLVLANSGYAAECYPEFAPVTVAGAIDGDIFRPIARPQRRVEDVLRVAVPVGRNKPRKRVQDAIDACQVAASRGVDVELHLFDAVPNAIETGVRAVRHHGLSRREVAALMHAVDVALCPEEDAGWNNPAAEAMACGVPVICTRAGTTDFAIDGETALVVEPRNVRGFADALLRIANDPALGQQLAGAGAARVAAFTWPSLVRRLIDVLESARPDAERRSGANRAARKRIVRCLAELSQ